MKYSLCLIFLLSAACSPYASSHSSAGSTVLSSNSGTSADSGGGSTPAPAPAASTPAPTPTPTPTPSPAPAPTPTPAPAPAPAPAATNAPPPLSTDPSKLSAPWKSANSVIVIDPYEGNSMDWNKMAADPRLAGIIHRASIGLTEDTMYASRKAIAVQRGYFWGAYHLGKQTDPITQAKFFLNVVGTDPNTLWALDLEDTSSPTMMSASQAVTFLNYIYQTTGRLPIVYADNSVTLDLIQKESSNSIFKMTRLWYARFLNTIPGFPQGLWPTYFLWQFASELNCQNASTCPYSIPGTDYGMDVDVFYGTKAELEAQWTNATSP